MSRGYPDFFGSSIFPYSGPLRTQTSLVPLIFAGVTKEIFKVSTKGVIYGGFFRVQSCVNAAAVSIISDIDGGVIGPIAFSTLLAYRATAPYRGLPYLTCYDVDAQLFVFAFDPGVSFGIKYSISIENGSVAQVLIDGTLFYTQII